MYNSICRYHCTAWNSIVIGMRGVVLSSNIRRLHSAFPSFSLSTGSHFSTRPTNENDTGASSIPYDAGPASAIARLSGEFDADAAEKVAKALNPAQRVLLASALREQIQPDNLNDTYFDQLWAASTRQGQMTELSFRKVLTAHALLNTKSSLGAPSTSALRMLFLASAIPFVGFGFLDNFIMLSVGEEIDAVFGVRLGLSTLASAGLGNLVADVVGVGAANGIERQVKKFPFIKNPNLSRAQEGMGVVKAAKLTGSLVGVVIGCLLGLTPLAISGGFFH